MNFFSEETRRNPYPVYDQLRRDSPVLHVPSLNLWMIFDYEGVKRAVKGLAKGDEVLVQGQLTRRFYRNGGGARSVMEVIATGIKKLDPNNPE